MSPIDAARQTRRLLEAVAQERDFGDPVVDALLFDPTAILRSKEPDRLTRFGAAVGLLVDFNGCIDNRDYQAALGTEEYRRLRDALEERTCSAFPAIEAAMKAAALSERAFYDALTPVLEEVHSSL